jgi:hypothetical protein
MRRNQSSSIGAASDEEIKIGILGLPSNPNAFFSSDAMHRGGVALGAMDI